MEQPAASAKQLFAPTRRWPRLQVLCVALGVLALYIAHQLHRVDVLLVGPVTIDVTPELVPGGAVTYAAGVLSALGLRACVVTVAGPDADLSVFKPHELYVVPSHTTLTFAHTYTWWGHSRKLHVTANPNVTLSRSHVPQHCQRARLVILGPLTLDDVDAASFLHYESVWDHLMRGPYQKIAYMAQGVQRQLGRGGAVMPLSKPSKQLMVGLAPHVSVFLSDVETSTWSAADIARVAKESERLLITQGDKGAEEWNGTGTHQIPAMPIPAVVDTNGAGDTFATVYSLAAAWGVRDPASVATYAASRAVMQPQACKPACVGNGWQHQAQRWPLIAKLWMDVKALGPHLASVCKHLIQEATKPVQPSLGKLTQAGRDSVTAAVQACLPGLYTEPISYQQHSSASHNKPPPPAAVPTGRVQAAVAPYDPLSVAVRPVGMLSLLFPTPQSAAAASTPAPGICPSGLDVGEGGEQHWPACLSSSQEQCDAGECYGRKHEQGSWRDALLNPLNRVRDAIQGLVKGMSATGVHAAEHPMQDAEQAPETHTTDSL